MNTCAGLRERVDHAPLGCQSFGWLESLSARDEPRTNSPRRLTLRPTGEEARIGRSVVPPFDGPKVLDRDLELLLHVQRLVWGEWMKAG